MVDLKYFEAGGKLINILNGIGTGLGFILLIVHAYRMHQDLFTSERKSVLHRRFLPKINTEYKLIAWCTFFSAFFLVISKLFNVIWGTTEESGACKTHVIISSMSYYLAKLFMYWIFLLRLKAIYGSTEFAYNTFCLKIWGVFFAFYLMLGGILVSVGFTHMKTGCTVVVDEQPLLLVGSGMAVGQDFFFSLGFVIAFVVPLKKVMKHVDALSDNNPDTQQHKKLIYAAVKVTTLTSTSVVTTVGTVLVIASITLDTAMINMIIDIVCLFLMTPYYPSAVYYEKICCCCIWCCTPKEDVYKSKVREDGEVAKSGVESVTLGVSADTMDQLNVAARDVRNDPLLPVVVEDTTDRCAQDSYSNTPVITENAAALPQYTDTDGHMLLGVVDDKKEVPDAEEK